MSIAPHSLLIALGHPAEEHGQPALCALHAGAAYHRLAVILETLEAYASHAVLPPGEPAGLLLAREAVGVGSARARAEGSYRRALELDERLAEAWFNLGRLLQHAGERDAGLAAFERVVELEPHARALPHAQLHANAHWHAATLLEDMGREEAAMNHYRAATAHGESFGVHHDRYAHFLRRCGRLEEAILQYERMMTYSHRYFTEFVLPPLKAPMQAAPAPEFLDVIYETTDGAAAVFWNSLYWRIPRDMLPVSATSLSGMQNGAGQPPGGRRARLLAMLRRMAFWKRVPEVRSAVAISDFEEARN